MASEEDFQAKLQACHVMCSTYLEDLKEERQVEGEEKFDSVKHQDTMVKLSKILAHDATKLTLACKPPRKPEDAIKMIQEISNTFYRIVGFHHTIPSEAGKIYKATYATMLRGLLQGAMSLCGSFMTTKPSSFMVPTAVLWETCKEMERSAPADNKVAVRRKWVSMRELVMDAKSEVLEIAEEETERRAAKQCADLVSLTTLLFQKIERRSIPDSKSMTWLDRVCESGQTVADEVDVLVSQLYDTEDDSIMHAPLLKFVDCVTELVDIVQEDAKDEHAKWFEMCMVKVNSIVPKYN
ncbi:hypothetical protein DFQ28_002668 [Apophysomyces sp. BC1034]|nr:hypothetical protein DFQ30_005068 [Apophysomyces sp. BC1015]KAG0179630.1 hypothetical protein DFQ29_001858 [Apophysomyces sp. BC1021]KAG0189970.1 hypothetical protein DFQ28_002668 [Apophysomyces sp. BC1034]